MPPVPTILIATKNAGKLREIREILEGLSVRLVSVGDGLPEPIENAATFQGNAELKVLHYARLSGGWALADDSGLEVDALGGQPGVRSARYAGETRDDEANNAKLLEALAGVPPTRRTARFRCVVALANTGGVLATASGTLEGVIVDEARGVNGFGYDPHFFVPAVGMTAAEMSPDQKNRISHRGQAFRAILPAIERLPSAPEPGASQSC